MAVDNNGKQTHYQYDPLGRRISKTSSEAKTEFLWLEDVLLSETEHDLTNEAQPPKRKHEDRRPSIALPAHLNAITKDGFVISPSID